MNNNTNIAVLFIIGAILVVIGALLKILHIRLASLMLIVGMTFEAAAVILLLLKMFRKNQSENE